MEPRIQYAKTSDGVNIAYASMGEGPPLIRMPQIGVTHVQREPEIFPDMYERLPRTFRFIIYDARGTSLSEEGRGAWWPVGGQGQKSAAVVSWLRLV